jgi:hypothetical protein
VQIIADGETRQNLLRKLGGDGTKVGADEQLKVLGRNGQLPWLLADARIYTPYCKAARLVKSSPAHALLHGIVKPLVAYAVLAGKDEVPVPEQWGINPVVFDYQGRAILAVCPTGFQLVMDFSCVYYMNAYVECDSSASVILSFPMH